LDRLRRVVEDQSALSKSLALSPARRIGAPSLIGQSKSGAPRKEPLLTAARTRLKDQRE
jgi:hypothetical protein